MPGHAKAGDPNNKMIRVSLDKFIMSFKESKYKPDYKKSKPVISGTAHKEEKVKKFKQEVKTTKPKKSALKYSGN